MQAEARAARNEYLKEYRARNRERIREYQRRWAQDNPDKIRKYQEDYWLRKAKDHPGNSNQSVNRDA